MHFEPLGEDLRSAIEPTRVMNVGASARDSIGIAPACRSPEVTIAPTPDRGLDRRARSPDPDRIILSPRSLHERMLLPATRRRSIDDDEHFGSRLDLDRSTIRSSGQRLVTSSASRAETHAGAIAPSWLDLPRRGGSRSDETHQGSWARGVRQSRSREPEPRPHALTKPLLCKLFVTRARGLKFGR